MNHNTAPVEVREQLAFSARQMQTVLDALSAEGAQECLVLSTCNRTEFYVAGSPPDELAGIVRRALPHFVGGAVIQTPEYWYERENGEAVSHLFRVASGMDSLVLGEPEVLGQVKEAFDSARAADTIGVFLGEVYRRCLHVAKQVRTETSLGFGSVSLASAALNVLEQELGGLTDRHVALLGTGEIAAQAATAVASASPATFWAASRSRERAEQFAVEHGARPLLTTDKPAYLPVVDAIICATACPSPILRVADIAGHVPQQRQRPLVIVDLAHPRNVEPDVRTLSFVRLYAMDDLRTVIERNLVRRRAELPFAEAIVRRETAQLATWHASRPLTAVIKDFRRTFEEVRRQEVERLRTRLSEAEWRATDEASRRILAKLLHIPTLALKSLNVDDPADRERLAAVVAMFDLRPSAEEPPPR
jgi:glutamyl-tRNA reductase